MRELKFRAWDLEFKEMITEDLMISSSGDLYCNYKTGAIKAFPTGTYEIMEYTGFKDKNNKEIYEGDIFKSSGEYRWSEVKFEEGKFIINLRGARRFDLCELFEGHDRPEVIGNIFENPELLG